MQRHSSSGVRSPWVDPSIPLGDADRRGEHLISPEAAPIGIFDSGVGGLTVLQELYEQLPQESILYFGDTARLPYGTRSQPEIIDFVRDILDWMAQQGCKMVIMACNTSSALALEAVQGDYDFPVLGIILPGAQAAALVGDRIGVISTPATASSGAYSDAVHEIDSQKQVWQIGCPEFVHIVEQGRILEPESRVIIQRYLAPLIHHQIDTLVYGCTHYPHLAPVLQSLLGDSVAFVDPAVNVVAAAARELDAMGLRNLRQPQPTRFCVSGTPQQFADISTQWLGYRPDTELVNLAIALGRPIAEPSTTTAIATGLPPKLATEHSIPLEVSVDTTAS
jgi:glutamate racemase